MKQVIYTGPLAHRICAAIYSRGIDASLSNHGTTVSVPEEWGWRWAITIADDIIADVARKVA